MMNNPELVATLFLILVLWSMFRFVADLIISPSVSAETKGARDA